MPRVHTFHISINGAYAPCEATKRPCPRGGHISLSSKDYEEVIANKDPRFLKLPATDTPLASAHEAEFKQAYEEYKRSQEAGRLHKEVVDEWKKENPFPSDAGRPLLGPAVDRTYKAALDEVQKLLIQQGVAPQKARFIVQDTPVDGPDAFLPPVKKKDKFDPDIQEKTEKARHLAQDSQKVQIAREVQDRLKIQEAYFNKSTAVSMAARKQVEAHLGKTENITQAARRLEEAQAAVTARRAWVANGVPGDAREVANLGHISPASVYVGEDGNINNLWYTNTETGKVERIVSYQPGDWETPGGKPGKFLTDQGTEVVHTVRYANHKKTEKNPAVGTTRILIQDTPGEGTRYPTGELYNRQHFGAYQSLDSGD